MTDKAFQSYYSNVVMRLMSVNFPHLSVGTLATGQMAVHLPGTMLNFVAESTDRARIATPASVKKVVTCSR
jgi:hypothetical protein